jgi:hypothetical protein
MPNAVENAVRNAGCTKVRYHGWELALIPTLRDTSGDVEGCTRDSEQVLTLAYTRRNVVSKGALLSGNAGVGLCGSVPYQRRSVMVGAGSVW